MKTKATNRREFLRSSAILGASLGVTGTMAWGAGSPAAPGAGQKRPNVLFICTDQQRVDDMSCAGNPYVKTPAVDGLAARGARFTRSYCAFPLCSPSRATHVTSRMSYEIGINTNGLTLPEGLPSMGTIFKEAGYRTVWTGKWHLPSTYPTDRSEIPGFEVIYDPKTAQASAPAKAKKAQTKAASEGGEAPQDQARPGMLNDPHVVNAAVRFLKEKPQQPFLLTVSLMNPHDICGFNEGSPAKLGLPTDASTMPPVPANLDAPDLGPAVGNRPDVPPPTTGKRNFDVQWSALTWRQQMYFYYQLTERVDRLIGEVLKALREAGLEENTLVLFTSDHGEMGGAHHRVRKMSLYEEAMEVPFILAGPGVPAGATDKTHFVSGLDVLPTLCDFAGLTPPPDTRGLSVKKLLDDPKTPWRDAVFAALSLNGGRMVRTERYKYNLYYGNKEELLDLQADPGEAKNLVADPAMAETLEAHRKLLHDWMAKTKDPFGKPEAEKPLRPAGEKGAGKKAAKGKAKKTDKAAPQAAVE